MSCNSFEEKIVAIARGELLDAELKQQTFAHIEICSQCAERLHNEKVLNERLKAFAVVSSQASSMIEKSLREVFAAQVAKQNQTVVIMPRLRQRGAWVIGGAIAATLLVVVGLFAQSFSSANKNLTGVVLTTNEFVDFERAIEKEDWNDFVKVDLPNRRTSFYANAKPRNYRNANLTNKDSETETEIATDFMPLMQDGSDEMPANGQIVRVELPRSALVAFGLPIDVERGNEKITADVVVSEEGIARAIRFVQTGVKR
jgi:hypothetical protein